MGASGTYFWVDPTEQLVVVQMIHVSGGSGPFQRTLRNLTYGAFRVPDQGIPDAAAGALRIDADALAAYAGTYRFASSSARDRQEYPEFGGLGIDVAMKNGVLNVVSPFRDMPAAKAGVLIGDVITHLNGEPTRGMVPEPGDRENAWARQHDASSQDRAQGAGYADRARDRPRGDP
jgi:hypothetical protein